MRDVRRTEGEPHDWLTEYAGEMVERLEELDQAEGIQAIVMLRHDEMYSAAIRGFESDHDAIAFLFAHLAGMFEANGQKLAILPMGSG